MTRATGASRKHALEFLERLRLAHPDAHCELIHDGPFQLLVATVLSAQSTDVAVNQVTPGLFERYPTPGVLAAARLPDIELLLARLGMFRQKAKSIVGLSERLVVQHGGEVPRSLDALVQLPGVGRKTANVVLGVAFGVTEGVVVDTHVQRLSQRLGLSCESEPTRIEQDLMKLFPRESWVLLSHTIIFHGRRICTARNPACSACVISDSCPSAFQAETVRRKAPAPRRPKRDRAPLALEPPTPSRTKLPRAETGGAATTPSSPAKRARMR